MLVFEQKEHSKTVFAVPLISKERCEIPMFWHARFRRCLIGVEIMNKKDRFFMLFWFLNASGQEKTGMMWKKQKAMLKIQTGTRLAYVRKKGLQRCARSSTKL